MTEAQALEILIQIGAVIIGDHIVYASGLHGIDYIDPDKLYPHDAKTSQLSSEIAREFVDDGVEAVVAPEGGIALARGVAYHLSQQKSANERTLAFFAKKTKDNQFVFKHGGASKLLPGRRALVVDDILTTGGTAKKVIEAIRAIGGKVIGLGILCNRGRMPLKDVSYPPKMFSLVKLNMNVWTQEECKRIGPCSRGVPVNPNVGHGRAFLGGRR